MMKLAVIVLLAMLLSPFNSPAQATLYVSLEPEQAGCCDDIVKKIDDKFRSKPTLYKVVDYLPFNTFGGSTQGKKLLIKGRIRPSGAGFHVSFEVKDLVTDRYLELRNSVRSIATMAPSKWLDWVSAFQEDVSYYERSGRVKINVLVEPIVCLDEISQLDAHNLRRMFSTYTQLLNAHDLFNKHFHFVESDPSISSRLSPVATNSIINSPFVIPVMNPPIQFIARVPVEPSFANIEKLPTNLRDSLWIKYSRIQH